MMNALFGVLGATACRFFDGEIANAITLFGQQTLRWTRAAFEEAGVPVLYGDTDSVFVKLSGEEPEASAQDEARALRAQVEQGIMARIRAEYGVEPRLTLELEHVLARFFMPRVRSGAGGSKKRYAGWVDGALLVVGLDSVRRDWPAVARRLQEGILTGPVIRYVITRDGPEPVLPGRPLPAGIDRGHSVEKVLRPIADAILAELGHSFDEVSGAPLQLQLL